MWSAGVFSIQSCADLYEMPQRQKWLYFLWPVRVLTSGIFANLFLDFQNSTFKYLYRICKVFWLFLFFSPCADLCESMRVPWWDKWWRFVWSVRVPKRGISRIWKKHLRSSEVCHFFRYLKFHFQVPLEALQSVSTFFDQDLFNISLQVFKSGTQTWNIHAHT
jgi:hypothetical protein